MNTAKRAPAKKGGNKINFIDILLLILILLVVTAALYFLFDWRDEPAKNGGVPIEFQLKIDRLRSEMTEHISVGDKMYSFNGDILYGEVVATDVRPSVAEIYDYTNDEMVRAEYPDRYALYITLSAKAQKKNDGLYIEEEKILLGSDIEIRFPYFVGIGSFVSVSEKAE